MNDFKYLGPLVHLLRTGRATRHLILARMFY